MERALNARLPDSRLSSCAQVVALVKGMLKINPVLEAMTERVG